jgi:hypothetical protein
VKYQLRLIDQNLPGLTREMALACWHAVDAMLPDRPDRELYRSLYRAVQGVFKERVQAFRYCGAAHACDRHLQSTELGEREWLEPFPPESERIHRFVIGPETPPSVLVREILRATLLAVASDLPKRRLKGLARFLRRQIEKTLHGRVFRSDLCGEMPLCPANEAVDPWDLRDPANALACR